MVPKHVPALLVACMALAAGASVPAQSPPIFRFDADGLWLNLHHFLYVLGRADAGMPDRGRRAVAGAPAEQAETLPSLSEADRQAWRDAVAFYAAGPGRRDLTFDRQLGDITAALRDARAGAAAASLPLDRGLAAALDRAAPIYRATWWPRHQRANHARLAEWQPWVARHGAAVQAFLMRVYQLPWEPGGLPVNVSAYANWAGAYSTRGPLVVLASLDDGLAGSLGLEMLFHEAMHQWDDRVLARLQAVAGARGLTGDADDLSHAMIFYTAGEAVRRVVPAHRPYAEVNGLWEGRWRGRKATLDAAWKPYLDGRDALDDALAALLGR